MKAIIHNYIRNKFWRDLTWKNHLLTPFALAYYAAFFIKYNYLTKPQKLSAYTICVGNIVLGGAGKTPFAMELGRKLLEHGHKIAFISKGYGSQAYKSAEVIKVQNSHKADQVGDEPLVLSQIAPTYVSRNRIASSQAAIADGANVLIYDDGMQDNSFVKDYTFMLVDARYGFGNKYPLPMGPLREPLRDGYLKSNAVVLVGTSVRERGAKGVDFDILAIPTSTSKPDDGVKYLAFCGIADPFKFYESLVSHGFEIAQTVNFPDHHNYTDANLQELLQRANNHKCKLITTAKDFVKIPQHLKSQIDCFEYKLNFDLPEDFLIIKKPQ